MLMFLSLWHQGIIVIPFNKNGDHLYRSRFSALPLFKPKTFLQNLVIVIEKYYLLTGMALEKIGPPGSEVSNAKECRDFKKCMNSSLLLNTGDMED